MRIFLIGFMGAGKSRVGSILARRQDFRFVDLDYEIEKRARLSIPTIFDRFGEQHFRELEYRCLGDVARWGNVVVATGGGAFTFDRNRELIGHLGVSVWLHPSFETILRRLGPKGRRARPLFRSEPDARELHDRRCEDYRRADYEIVVAMDETAAEVAARIASLFE